MESRCVSVPCESHKESGGAALTTNRSVQLCTHSTEWHTMSKL